MNRHLHVNPYIAGSPVTGTEMFFGRDDVFTFIRRNLIGRHRDTPVVLYGQRRTGKTSVLYQLHRHLDPSYRCIFIDLHGLSLDGMGSLLHGIASSISRDLRREHHLTVPVPDRSLFLAEPRSAFQTRFLDAALSALGDDHLVLMLDEVVRLYEEVEHGRLEHEIFDFLRHLMQHYERLNFIFSLGSGLEEMAREYAFLFSVSLYHRISFLEPAAARSLITEPAREHYQVAPQAVMKILEITSGHPYYTQLVCHCLFDSWSRAPRPVMDVPDVEAILAEAIELGSANLTYVWEDSAPEEQALMAGIAATGGHDAGAVTMDQVRETWHEAGVTLPEREITRAARSLISRDVLAGDQAYSFNVDLQRLWLVKHRRMDWVKDELADSIQQWNRSAAPWPAETIPAQATGTRQRIKRRALGIAAIAVVLASYFAVAAATRIFPFSSSQGPPEVFAPSVAVTAPPTLAAGVTPLLQLLPGDIYDPSTQCHPVKQPYSWHMPGLFAALDCGDQSLPNGHVEGYQMDTRADFETAWRNFNTWWGFDASNAALTCPPPGGSGKGSTGWNSKDFPQMQGQVVECERGSRNAPVYVWTMPSQNTFMYAVGASGSSFSALNNWWTNDSRPANSPSPSAS